MRRTKVSGRGRRHLGTFNGTRWIMIFFLSGNQAVLAFKRQPLALLLSVSLALTAVVGVWNTADAAKATSKPSAGVSKNLPKTPAPRNEINDRLSKMEETVFVTTYHNDSQNDRLNRLEAEVFAQTSPTLTTAQRLDRLEKMIVLPLQPNQGQSNAPASLDPDWNNQPAPLSQSARQPAANTTASSQEPALEYTKPSNNAGSYVTTQGLTPSKPSSGNTNTSALSRLDAIEQYIFNKTYSKDTIVARLNRLETQVFQTPQKGTVTSRINALNQTVLGEPENTAQAANPPAGNNWQGNGAPNYNQTNPYNPYAPPLSQNTYAPPVQQSNGQGGNVQVFPDPDNGYSPKAVYNGPPPDDMAYADPAASPQYNDPNNAGGSASNTSNNNASPAVKADMNAAVGSLEQQLLKKTYPQEALDQRLGRLETKVFKQPSPDMAEEDRLERLIAVVAADGNNPKPMGRGATWQALLPFLIILPLMLL